MKKVTKDVNDLMAMNLHDEIFFCLSDDEISGPKISVMRVHGGVIYTRTQQTGEMNSSMTSVFVPFLKPK